MAQHDSNGGNDRHLTTEQLSALLDNQLPANAQAAYEAHLNTCRHCQRAMANLRQTVALLHALPQPSLPRSFTLPASMGVASEQPDEPRQLRPIPTTAGRGRRERDNHRAYLVRRTVRAISTIAAAIGLVFLLSSFVAGLPHGGSSASTSSGIGNGGASNGSTLGPHQAQGATTPHYQTPASQCSKNAPSSGSCHTSTTSPTPTSTPVPMPSPTQTAGQNKPYDQQNQANAPPDLNSPQAHLAYGAVLLLLGLLGVALTRRRRD